MNKQFIAILVVIIGGLFAILAFTNKDKPGDQSSGSSNSQPTSHKAGKVDSKVVLQEFGDFQCPACKAYYPILKQLKIEYGDRVAFQFSHFPLTQIHTNAFIGSRAAEAAAKQGKFFEMHDLLYEQQDSWSPVGDPTSIFVSFASQLGINADQFKTDMVSTATTDAINADRKVAQDLGSTATPTFAINGKKLDKNPTDIEGFKTLLDEALSANQ